MRQIYNKVAKNILTLLTLSVCFLDVVVHLNMFSDFFSANDKQNMELWKFHCY